MNRGSSSRWSSLLLTSRLSRRKKFATPTRPVRRPLFTWAIGVERDGRPRPFAHPADDEVLLDLAAGADAPVAQDAGGMVHLDDRRRVVDAPGAEPRRESRRLQSGATRLSLQLTVPRGRLPQAGTGMVGQQQLVEHASGPLHALGVRAHVHARLDGP